MNRKTWDASAFVSKALEGYIPHEERALDLTEAAIAELDAGGPTDSNEEVMAWIEIWGKPDELPAPSARGAALA